jgi:hypothetical protein
LLIYGRKEIVRLNKSLKNERVEELDEYAVLKNKLDKYFAFEATLQDLIPVTCLYPKYCIICSFLSNTMHGMDFGLLVVSSKTCFP